MVTLTRFLAIMLKPLRISCDFDHHEMLETMILYSYFQTTAIYMVLAGCLSVLPLAKKNNDINICYYELILPVMEKNWILSGHFNAWAGYWYFSLVPITHLFGNLTICYLSLKLIILGDFHVFTFPSLALPKILEGALSSTTLSVGRGTQASNAF